MIDFYKMWLGRARGATLSLNVEDILELSEPVPGTRASLFKIVVELSQQWQNIELLLRDDLLESLPVQGKYPVLEKLTLAIAGPWLDLPISFREAPQLREVVLSPYMTEIQLPWHQLTSFRSDNIIQYRSFLEILHCASNLVDGRFGILSHVSGSELPKTVVPLPQLQSLSLEEEDPDFWEPLMTVLDCLKAPSLKNFALFVPHHSFHSRNSTDISPFLSFVSRSSFQLHTLVLSNMPETTELLIQCLKATPSVVHLKLQPNHLVINTTIAQFTGHADFLPKLESFHLVAVYSRVSGVTLKTATDVADMLRWRWAAVGIARLQSFRFAYDANAKKMPALDEMFLSSHSKFRRLEE
ncbi:hypothetical protein B0H13DRAFT_2670318 [Mycena leptocephala]|nr:hypothetical protein B0H13DRAFT_2670318 [Mycena leptocephala]